MASVSVEKSNWTSPPSFLINRGRENVVLSGGQVISFSSLTNYQILSMLEQAIERYPDMGNIIQPYVRIMKEKIGQDECIEKEKAFYREIGVEFRRGDSPDVGIFNNGFMTIKFIDDIRSAYRYFEIKGGDSNLIRKCFEHAAAWPTDEMYDGFISSMRAFRSEGLDKANDRKRNEHKKLQSSFKSIGVTSVKCGDDGHGEVIYVFETANSFVTLSNHGGQLKAVGDPGMTRRILHTIKSMHGTACREIFDLIRGMEDIELIV